MPNYGSITWKASLLAGMAVLLAACGGGSNKRVYFGNLEDGSNVESPFKVDMKAENLIVEPATMGVTEGHGHFHIVVDAPLASPSEPMPKDAKHIHYGEGQTSTVVDLPVGQHTLILQFAKGDHVPYDPPVYQQIQINVTKQNMVDTAQAKAPDTSATLPVGSATTTSKDSAVRGSSTVKTSDTIGMGKQDSLSKDSANKHEGHKKEKK